MQKVLCFFLFLFSMSLNAQHDSLLAFLKASYEQEKSWQSGEIEITNYHMDGDSIISSDSGTLTFFNQLGKPPLFLLENSSEGIYYTNEDKIEYVFREHRRQWHDLRWPESYKWQFNAAFDELAINPYLDSDDEQVYILVENFIRLGKDSLIEWDQQARQLKVKVLRRKTDQMVDYMSWVYKFDNQKRLISSKWCQEVTLLGAIADSVIIRPNRKHRTFSYSHINQVPYISIIQQIKKLQSLPLQTVFKPEPMEIDSSPKIGEQFPNLVLMDVMGDQTHLADIYGPKVLIYAEFSQYAPDSLYAFIDSMEDVFPNVTFMLITHLGVDRLYYLKRDHPSLKSFYLASRVEGLYLNGWPVWLALDGENKLIAENHGFQSTRKKEYMEWIKALPK